jgi:transposase
VLAELGVMRDQGEGIPRMFEEMEVAFLPVPALDVISGPFCVVLCKEPIFASADPAWPRAVRALPISLARSVGRKPVPPSMRREIVKVPVDPEDLCCCGTEKKVIGTHTRITIEYRPGEAYAIEERAEVRACRICESNVTTTPTTPPPIESARPGPGMLAQIVTSKNSDAVPLERQSKILARGGARVAPSTLGDWYTRAADLVEPCGRRSATIPCCAT